MEGSKETASAALLHLAYFCICGTLETGTLGREFTCFVKKITSFLAHSSYVLDLQFTNDGGTLVSSGMDNVVNLWSTADWTAVATLRGHKNSVNSISLSPDERTLATASTDHTVKLWSFPAGHVQHSLSDRKKTVAAVQISPDGAWVGSAAYGGRASIWTLDGEPVVGIKASKKNVTSLAFSANTETLAVSGLGDDITLWSLPEGGLIGTLTGHQTAVGSLSVVKSGEWLASLGYEGVVKLWDTRRWELVHSLDPAAAAVRGFCFSADTKILAVSAESKVQLWSVDGWILEDEIPVSTKVVGALAFSPDNKMLAIGGADKKIRIWQIG